MPLDVNPLTPLRRIIMILFMLTLLALSLGFAQYLITRHEIPALLHVSFHPPAGLSKLPVNDSFDDAAMGPLVEGLLKTADGPRHLHAFFFKDLDEGTPQDYLQLLLDRILPDPSERAVSFHPASLSDQAALESERHVGQGADSAFAIIRLLMRDGCIVAFCFSGEGLITDADRQFVEAYGAKQIEIRIEKPSRKG